VSVEQHEIHEQSVGAYLLGALSDVERHAFEGHAEECHVCRDELERLRPAADALPRSVTPVRPPPSLKSSLMETVESEAREAGGRAGSRTGRALGSVSSRVAAFGRSLAPRRALVWAGASVALLVGALGGYAGTQLSDGGSRTLAARFDSDRVAGASGSLVVPEDSKAGATLRVHGMPSLPPHETYQVWLRRGGETIPKALFGVGEDGNGLTAVDGDLAGADAVLVTREPMGGARSPSGKPILQVSL
jgi:anti-sigma-K factor RskA